MISRGGEYRALIPPPPPPSKAMAFEAQYLQLLGVVLHALKIGHGRTSAGAMVINHQHFHTLLHFCPEDE